MDNPSTLSAALVELTRGFQLRPGAPPEAIAAMLAAARAEDMVLGNRALPADYLAFIAFSNGGYGTPGEGGLWLRLDPIEDVLAQTRAHRLPIGRLLIGSTQLGDGLVLDTRVQPTQVVTLDLSWWGQTDVVDVLGPSLEAALQTLAAMGQPPRLSSGQVWAPATLPASAQPKLAIGYVPSPQPVVTAMLKAAALKPGELLYDLGSGDGRIVLTAARDFGARGVGFELNMELIHAARAMAVAANARHTATYQRADLFTVDVSPADVVSAYLLPEMNARLLPQLRQLRPGARVVTFAFYLPDIPPARTAMVEYAPGVQGRVYVWEAPL